IDADGLLVTIAKDSDTVDVFVPTEELKKGQERKNDEPIRIYLEDAIAADRPFSGSEIKAIELDLLKEATAAKEANSTLPGYVVGEIKGGYSVALFAQTREEAEEGFGLRAFLPLGRTGLRRFQGLTEQDDPLVMVHITELDPVRGNIVVSRRELLAL